MRYILIAALVGLTSVLAHATVLVPADMGELARDARAIARGQVIAVDARWTDDRRTIETIITLQTETYLKGQLGPTVQFRVPGGTLGRFRNLVVGAPSFAVGERIVVFLGARGPSAPYVLGLSQGVFRVALSEDRRWIVNPPAVLPGTSGPIVRGSLSRQAAPLDEFERTVRRLATETQP